MLFSFVLDANVATDNKDPRYAGLFLKPSDRLEPSTPSLPWNDSGNRSQPTATVFACLGRFRECRLPAIATGCDRWAP